MERLRIPFAREGDELLLGDGARAELVDLAGLEVLEVATGHLPSARPGGRVDAGAAAVRRHGRRENRHPGPDSRGEHGEQRREHAVSVVERRAPPTVAIVGPVASGYVFTMYRADKFYGPDRQVLANISLSFLPGAKIGVLGPNGAGKSTLLRIMAGLEEPSSGIAELAPGATVGMLAQEPELDPERNVRENVEDGVREQRDLLDRFNKISAQFAEPDADFDALLGEQAKVQEQIDRTDAWSLEATLDRAMDALRLLDGDRDVTTLSGGERRQVALARLLLSSPDLLLLDEPTNHLDAESVAWLERFLEAYKGTVVAVTHDRYFLDNVAGWILELDRGKGIPFQGNYSSWLEQKQARLAQEEKTESARRRTLARELEWVRASPKARHAKAKARLTQVREAARGGSERQAGQGRDPHPGRAAARRRGRRRRPVSKAFGDRLLMQAVAFSLPPGGIVGVIGPNGAGKTTLFRWSPGRRSRTAGALQIGETVELCLRRPGLAESLEPRRHHLEIHLRRPGRRSSSGTVRVNSRATSPVSASPAPTSRARSASSPAANAAASSSPKCSKRCQRYHPRRADQRP